MLHIYTKQPNWGSKLIPNGKKRENTNSFPSFFMVPLTGVEPVRYLYRGILSPLRLPIPPQRHGYEVVYNRNLL